MVCHHNLTTILCVCCINTWRGQLIYNHDIAILTVSKIPLFYGKCFLLKLSGLVVFSSISYDMNHMQGLSNGSSFIGYIKITKMGNTKACSTE